MMSGHLQIEGSFSLDLPDISTGNGIVEALIGLRVNLVTWMVRRAGLEVDCYPLRQIVNLEPSFQHKCSAVLLFIFDSEFIRCRGFAQNKKSLCFGQKQ